MLIHWGHVTSLLVPLSMVVISHHTDVVKILGEHRDVIRGIHDLVAGGDCSGDEEAVGTEGLG